MINQTRPDVPQSLRTNAAKWTRDLLEQVRISEQTGQPIPRKYIERYNKDSVKNALDTMYGNLCCYCDSQIGIVDFPHIEHRRPSARFRADTFDWDNLHLACARCNNAKSDKWDEANPILDAVVDIPVTDHLDYCFERCVWNTLRGRTTRDHADLNRDRLVRARLMIMKSAIRLIEEINMQRQDWRVAEARRRLDEMCDEQYGSFIRYLQRAFLR